MQIDFSIVFTHLCLSSCYFSEKGQISNLSCVSWQVLVITNFLAESVMNVPASQVQVDLCLLAGLELCDILSILRRCVDCSA